MKKWTDRELKIIDEYFELEGVRGMIIRGVKKTSFEIVDKAIEKGKEVTIKNINLTNKEEYGVFIKKGYIIPKGWSKDEVDILLKYFPVGSYSLCKERGLTKSTYAVRKLVSYISLKCDRERIWCGIKIIDLVDIYDKYGLVGCCDRFPDLKTDAIRLKIEKYRSDVN